MKTIEADPHSLICHMFSFMMTQATLETTKEEDKSTIENLKSQHDEEVAQLKNAHSQETEELKSSHDAIVKVSISMKKTIFFYAIQ